MSFMWHTYELQKGDMKISTDSSSSTSVSEKINEYLNSNIYIDVEQLDNVTINGQEYVVLHDERWEMFILLTSRGGGPLDINSAGHFLLDIRYADSLDDVMPLLNTITVN
jgi:hypothetical protein